MMNSAFRMTRTTVILLAVLLALVLVCLLFNNRIQHAWSARLLLSSKNPSEELFSEIAGRSRDPVTFLTACWATGKVAHRQLVAAYLNDHAQLHAPWLARSEPLLLSCVTDGDASVRELGLAALSQLRSPHLFEAARVQLNDLDPLVRRVGLDYLRKTEPARSAPVLMRSLDDPDLRNVVTAESALMRISGVDFGVRASLAIDPQTGGAGSEDSSNVKAIRRGIEQRKQWWREHQSEYVQSPGSAVATTGSLSNYFEKTRAPAPDFTLHNLSGKNVSLSDFRGKVVLVNFWATWCTACLKEIPDLVALQEKMGNNVAILGISLDGVPDEDGDVPGEGGEHTRNGPSPLSIQAKIERAVKLRRINYPVLLDPKSSVGGQYRGGELPTTVIFDAEGRVCRRLIGERNLKVFQAMIAEAAGRVTSPLALSNK